MGWYRRAVHAHTLKVRPGIVLMLLSAAGTMLAVLLWLKVGLTAAAITYALTLGAVQIILRGRARAEARDARHAAKEIVGNESVHAADSTTKKVASSR
jgi:hypothetical protein